MSPSNTLSRLSVDGSRVVDSKGEPVLLRGVNRSGLEYSQCSIPSAELEFITQNWGGNVVRVPFNQDWVLNAEGYLGLLDEAIAVAARNGAYTLLDLQWLDAERAFGPERQFVAPLPNPDTAKMWATLARRYQDNPAVLFDLFNEPHDRARDDPYPLYRPDGSQYHEEHRRVSMTEWQPWAEMLVDTIRAEAPEALIFVSGTNWAYDLRGYPLNREGLVYSTHVYRNKGEDWFGAFGYLASHVPVFAGEFGGSECDLEWGRQLLDYFDELGIGWTAWSFADRPHLVDRATMQPTPFGELVFRSLQRCR
ncbi:MAG: glycoside hydrolase family 5 protein [Bryobacteraceae bacterium]